MSTIPDFIDLHSGEEDKKKVLENVIANTSFRGSNLWILACAIVVASVGLNVNSTAVIIGAMLISPLMGPIIGAGFSLGIFDFALLRKSLKNLIIATIVSLIVSTIYFAISPFKEAQSELLARTSPNIYDILIAFFGGLVGVIAITRVEKGNPIPGVAIATALMPPLCTAGYGLSTGNFKFFFGAMYLYTINCVFICIATFVIVKYLKYPAAQQIDTRHEKQVRWGITSLVLAMIVPSLYFAYLLIEEKKFNQKVAGFIEQEFTGQGQIIYYQKVQFNTTPKKISLGFVTKRFEPEEIARLNSKLKMYHLDNTQLQIRQDTTDLKRDILNEIGYDKTLVNEKDVTIAELQKELSHFRVENPAVLAELRILFPAVSSVSLSNHVFNQGTDSARTVPVLVYKGKSQMPDTTTQKLGRWLRQRLSSKKALIYFDK